MRRMMMLVLVGALLFAQPVKPSAIELFYSISNLILKNIEVIKGKLAYMRTEAKALANAEKASGDTVTSSIGWLHKYEQKMQTKRELGQSGFAVSSITTRGKNLTVSSFAPSACIRKKNNDISYDLAKNIPPIVKVIIDNINESISTENTTPLEIRERSLDIVGILSKNDKKKLNPFTLNETINAQQANDMSKVIAFIVNKSPPSNTQTPNSGNKQGDFHSKRIRYEEYVKIVQSIFIDKVSYYIAGEGGESKFDLMRRMRAKANTVSISEALTLKYEAGILKELNGTMSDLLTMDLINQKIKRDNLALMSILATGVTDELGDKL
jgi:hypothetical protein